MKKTDKPKSLSTLLIKRLLSIASISILTISTIWLFLEFQEFQNEIKILKTNYIEQQKNYVEQQVTNAISYIDNKKRISKNVNTDSLKQEILEFISCIRYNSEGYIFVNTYSGEALITDGKIVSKPQNIWELTDPNGVKVIQEERKAVNNPNGDFIYYTWNKLTKDVPASKVSFIKGIPDWEWMLGAGVIPMKLTKQSPTLRPANKRNLSAM